MTKPSFSEEKKLWEKGYKYVIGVDEVGRGAFAGPVVAAAVVFPAFCKSTEIEEVNDSKILSASTREKLVPSIKKAACAFAISEVSVSVINKKGIGKATTIALRKAIHDVLMHLDIISEKKKHHKGEQLIIPLSKKNYVLVDGFHVRYIHGLGLKNQKAIIKGDQKSLSIAAASILAKVYRDKKMQEIHKKYPMYNFTTNKGYGTKSHQEALKEYGLSKVHRTSFRLERFL